MTKLPTKGTQNGVSKRIAFYNLPLCRDQHTNSGYEEEITNIYIGCCHTADLHQRDGQCCQCSCKGANCECSLSEY